VRNAARLSTGLGARPILRDVKQLAAQAHVPLEEPGTDGGTDGPLPGLTPREREVLTHVVAGRTYAEIAAALFISEKTVSVHVSNLLRKTGTSSRIELAELARRRP
jgi:DNA-binding NarL/FixJ family response regulator